MREARMNEEMCMEMTFNTEKKEKMGGATKKQAVFRKNWQSNKGAREAEEALERVHSETQERRKGR